MSRSTLVNQPFLYISLPVILGIICSHIFWNEDEIFHFLNSYHSSFGDFLFPVITEIGNGYVMGLICLLLIAIEKKDFKQRFSTVFISWLIGALIILIAKNLLWPESPRPLAALGREALQVVEGVPIYSWQSFPSGHTATAFSLLFALSIPYAKSWQITAALIAILVGYSRIYLNQHFSIDVAVGATIGLFSGLMAQEIVSRRL